MYTQFSHETYGSLFTRGSTRRHSLHDVGHIVGLPNVADHLRELDVPNVLPSMPDREEHLGVVPWGVAPGVKMPVLLIAVGPARTAALVRKLKARLVERGTDFPSVRDHFHQ